MKNHTKQKLALSAMTIALFGAQLHAAAQQAPKDAEPATKAVNEAVLKKLPFADKTDFDEAKRGFIGTIPNATIKDDNGNVVWTMEGFGFLHGAKPVATLNPSLARFSALQTLHGLFHVAGSIYQIRGFDVTNMTIVEGKTGLIVIDPLMSAETGKAGMDLYFKHRPRKPVVAIIYTHSHIDHYGGVKGVVSADDVKAGKVAVIAPAGFMEHAIAENVLAGTAMSRRAHYQFAQQLERGVRGTVDGGMGKSLSHGTVTLIPPTRLIEKEQEKLTIDGVDMEFMLAQNTEAPSEMTIYFPQDKVFDSAELATTAMHQLYTLRGAEIRDGNAWAKAINKALAQVGDRAEVTIAQHTWPVFGKERVQTYLKKQRDTYKFINDQTLRLANHGYKSTEIVEMLKMPASLDNDWTVRGYYGTLNHNSKAVYQKYLGWYDANPANLNPVTPSEQGRKFVEYAGGADNVIKHAQADYKKGEYRWVAQAMSDVVFADPTNKVARNLGADALEQLGYQTENAIWRNVYLSGAYELRNGAVTKGGVNTLSPDTLLALAVDDIFDFLGVRLNGPKAEGKQIAINWNFTDSGKHYVLNLENCALTYLPDATNPKANATLTLTRETLDNILLKRTSFKQAVADGKLKLEGDASKVMELLGLLDNFTPTFEIIAPNSSGDASKQPRYD